MNSTTFSLSTVMRRTVPLALILAIAMSAASGQRPRSSSTKPSTSKASTRVTVGLKFMHHGTGTSCNTPLGLCLTIPFRLFNPPEKLSSRELAEGFGTADFEVAGDRLRMIFHRPAALPDGTVKLEKDKVLERPIAHALGYERIVLKKGSYKVDLSKKRFGETLIGIEKGPPTSPQNIQVVTCYRYAQTTGLCKGCGVACDDGTNYPMDCGADLFADITRCGGQRLSYDPRDFGPPQVFEGTPDVATTQPKGTLVKKFDITGAEVTKRAGGDKARREKFTLVIPKLRRRLRVERTRPFVDRAATAANADPSWAILHLPSSILHRRAAPPARAC